MGLGTKYGPGGGARGRASSPLTVQAPPTNPGNGSGGPGVLRAFGDTGRGGINLSPAIGEASDVKTGRITLAAVNTIIIVMVGFYYWTRSAQGGG